MRPRRMSGERISASRDDQSCKKAVSEGDRVRAGRGGRVSRGGGGGGGVERQQVVDGLQRVGTWSRGPASSAAATPPPARPATARTTTAAPRWCHSSAARWETGGERRETGTTSAAGKVDRKEAKTTRTRTARRGAWEDREAVGEEGEASEAPLTGCSAATVRVSWPSGLPVALWA